MPTAAHGGDGAGLTTVAARRRDVRRMRMISVRVSDEEFARLKVQSATAGARTISDYARLALCPETPPASDLHRLREQIERLGADVERIMEMMEVRAAAPPRPFDVPASLRNPEGRTWPR